MHPAMPPARALACAVALAFAGSVLPVPAFAAPASHVWQAADPAPWRQLLHEQLAAAAAARPARAAPSRAPATRSVATLQDTGDGSLRALLAEAVDGDVIDLRGLEGTISLKSSLATTADVTVKGPGEGRLVLEGSGKDRVITSTGSLALSGLTITGGAAVPAADEVVFGGCMLIHGDLQLTNATISGCTAGGAGTAAALGGAVFVGGESEIKYSTLEGNQSVADYYAMGGALFTAGPAMIARSTVSGNTARQIDVKDSSYGLAVATGGALVADDSLVLLGSTLSGNTAMAEGGTTRSNYYGQKYPVYGVATGGAVAGRDALLLASTITGNRAEVPSEIGGALGGGLYLQYSGGLYRNGVDAPPMTLAASSRRLLESQRASAGAAAARWAAPLEELLLRKGDILATTSGLLLSEVSGNLARSPEWSSGGGMFSTTRLLVYQSAVSNNSAQVSAESAYGGAVGGGIAQEGRPLQIDASTISGNTAQSTNEEAYAAGGGVAVYGAGLAMANTTVSGNRVLGGTYSYGGGIDAREATIHNSTIAFNTSSGASGGIEARDSGSLVLESTVLAHNAALAEPDGADVGGTGMPGGSHNLVMASTATLPPDTLGASPLLLPLAFNGGPTMTHAFAAASPLLDAGSNVLAHGEDQRGYAREAGAAPDIGALEHDDDRIFEHGFEARLGGP